MNTCTQCGLCDEVCPESIEIGGMLLEARRYLHKQDTMPGAYHQFWIRDMEFTNSPLAALTKKAPGQTTCTYAFFPGCQLGAANPNYVMKPYKWLLSQKSDTGLILRCCSVPADWAGNTKMHKKEIDILRNDWEKLGNPTLIMACPACIKHFKEYLPEIETISLYEIMNQWGGLPGNSPGETDGQPAIPIFDEIYSIFDPCTARHIAPMEQAVRKLAENVGVPLEELPKGNMHGCCGYGGQVSVADPIYYNYVKKSRSQLSENPYLVYCINCRDVFQSEGKKVWHILDLLFHMDSEGTKPPSLTQRRNNRIFLKKMLLQEIWEETMENPSELSKFQLKIGPEIQDKMDRMKILEEDLYTVIEYAENSGRRALDPEKKTYSCYRESGHITYWVEYRKEGEIYEIVNVYTHRMKIKLEGVWNGRKTESDL